jgi:hypothetical protein
MFSACLTTSNAGNAYTDLDYRWSIDGVEYHGPEAAHVFREVGQYQVVLTATGRNENGNTVTAPTSTLRTIGSYYLFRAGATGGTFTLSLIGMPTQPIPWNTNGAAIKAAIEGLNLSTPDAVDLRFNGNIELRGIPSLLKLDASGLTGCTGIPQLRSDLAASISDYVTVTDNWPKRYLDSTYTGGNSDGSIDRPYTKWSDVAAWIGDTRTVKLDRIACIKRGSSFVMDNAINYDRGNRGVRIVAYGEGSKPVIRCAGRWSFFQWEQSWGAGIGGDFAFSDIEFAREFDGPMFFSYASNNGNQNEAYSAYRDLVWDRCDYRQTGSGPGGFVNMQTTRDRGTGVAGIHVMDCTQSLGNCRGQAILCGADQWFSVCGGSISGGVGDIFRDHHIYSNVKGHQLFSGITFGAASKNFCLNINADNAAGAVQYCVVDGCNITGTQNGIDLSNTTNDRAQPGLLDDVVIQFCTITPGGAGSQRLGLYGQNHRNVTLRYSELTGNTGGAVKLYDHRVQFSMYGCKIDGGVIEVGAPYYSEGNVITGAPAPTPTPTPVPQPTPVPPPVVPTRMDQVRSALLRYAAAEVALTLAESAIDALEITEQELKEL